MNISREISLYLLLFLGTALLLSVGILVTMQSYNTQMDDRETINTLQKSITDLEHEADEPPRSWNSTRVARIDQTVQAVTARGKDLAIHPRYSDHQETIKTDIEDIKARWDQFESLDTMEGTNEPVQQHKEFLTTIEATETDFRSLKSDMGQYESSLMTRTSFFAAVLIITLLIDVIISRYLFKRRFTGPIQSLTDVVNRISKGETDVEIDAALKERDDEIGRLARSFERTLTSLKLAMEKSAPVLEEKNRSLKDIITEKQKIETSLEETITTLDTTLNCIEEGILVVAPDGNILHNNEQFQEMWNIPDELMQTKDDDKLIEHVKDQLKNPEQFQERVKELYKNPEGERHDTIEFKDEKRFRRIFKPLRSDDTLIGWAWVFKDISSTEASEI